MDTAIVVALLSAAVSLASVVVTARQAGRARRAQAELEEQKFAREQEAKHSERRDSADIDRDRHWQPVIEAARDVGHRLRNIREGGFGIYLDSDDPRRREIALRGTTFRLARYWGAVERLDGWLNRTRLGADPRTAAAAQLERQIGETFTSDSIDAGRFMMWREEQRAIGEVMTHEEGLAGSGDLGFARFCEVYDVKFAAWFQTFETDLSRPGVEASRRLGLLQQLFFELAACEHTSSAPPGPGVRTDERAPGK